jgi:hypothetical protein
MLMKMDVLRLVSNNTMCHVMVLQEVQNSLVDHLQSQRKYLRVKTKHFNGQNLSTYSNTLLMKLLQIRDHLIQQISCSGWFATMVASHYCFLFFYEGTFFYSAFSWILQKQHTVSCFMSPPLANLVGLYVPLMASCMYIAGNTICLIYCLFSAITSSTVFSGGLLFVHSCVHFWLLLFSILNNYESKLKCMQAKLPLQHE